MDNRIIAIDCDDVLANSYQAVLDFYGGMFNGKPLSREQITSFYLRDIPGYVCDASVEGEYFEGFYKKPENILSIPMIHGSYEAIQSLKNMGYILKIVTGRREIIADETQQWIEKNYPHMFDDIVYGNHGPLHSIGRSKADLLKHIGATILIDDAYHNAEILSQAGMQTLLYDTPWNQTKILPAGIQRVYIWEEIVEYFST